MMRVLRIVPLALPALLVAAVVLAAEADKKPKPLFDGKTLDGWKVVRCQAEVQDGAILIKGGNGVVRPDREFKNYVLELDWKALKEKNWDSGIYIRCPDPDPNGKRPWPQKYQVNLRQGDEGNMAELPAARSKGLCKDREWNHFKLTVKGTACELEINGKPAWKADGLEVPSGFISLQAEVPGGGQFLFKNITIVELE